MSKVYIASTFSSFIINMGNHYQLSDQKLERQIEDGTMNPKLFNHEAHLRLAWIHIRNYGVEEAVINICSQLKKYVKSVGAEDKYNETLTVAAIRAVYHFTLKSDSEHFRNFINEFPMLKFDFKELIYSHYSHDVFSSPKAKMEYLEPDLLPFD